MSEVPWSPTDDQETQEVRKQWTCLTSHDDGVLFSLSGSRNLLFVQLPYAEGAVSAAWLFGTHAGDTGRCHSDCPGCPVLLCLYELAHAAEVSALTRDDKFAISGAADGSVKLWSLDEGHGIDTYEDPSASKVTALTIIAAIMVSACCRAARECSKLVGSCPPNSTKHMGICTWSACPEPGHRLQLALKQAMSQYVTCLKNIWLQCSGFLWIMDQSLRWQLACCQSSEPRWHSHLPHAVQMERGWLPRPWACHGGFSPTL